MKKSSCGINREGVLFFIQSFHKEGKLISEQNPAENSPLIQLALDPSHDPPT
jgi:hypothetical protein